MKPARAPLILAFLALLLIHAPASGQETPGAQEPKPFVHAPFVGKVIRVVHTEIRDCPWCSKGMSTLVSDLVSLREGGVFTEERFRLSMEALHLSRRFEEVSARVDPLEDGVAVTLLLKPCLVIQDIDIQGEYPLFESDILKAMSVYVGDSLLPGTLAEQERLLRDLYQREGYLDPRISVRKADASPGTASLQVSITPGDYYSLKSLEIRGNNAISEAEILSRMSAWRQSFFIRESGRFLEWELAQDVKDLKALYWQRGYPDCDIEYTVERDEAARSVRAVVTITEGPKYRISITGNHHFWTWSLRQDVVIFSEGNRRGLGLRKSIRNIVERYRQAGFISAEVAVLEEKESVGKSRTRSIELAVTEGPRTAVASVSLSGNAALSEKMIKNAMRTGRKSLFGEHTFNPDILEDDLAAVKALYQRHGYTAVKITPEQLFSADRTSVSIAIAIEEGPRTVVTSMAVEGLHSIPVPRALEALGYTKGMPYRETMVPAGQDILSDLVSARGHPYVKVNGEARLSEDLSGADVVFRVEEGPAVTMGNTYYRGNFATRTSVIRRELEIEPGDPFSLKAMLDGQKRIRDMQAFESVQFKTMGIKEGLEKVTLLVDVEEVRPYYLQAGLGYVSDRGLYANAKAGDRNLFGLNKHAWLGGEASQIGYRGDLGVSQQRIFGAQVLNTFSLSYEKKEEFNQIFGTKVATSALNFLWEHEPHLTTSLGFRYELRDQYLQDSSSEIPSGEEDSYERRNVLVTTPSIS
ncbi:MAG TPA: POTRA domain-containing protein, partial [Deltaproteobacteria bacterium]|nr:POTRA domain-containing protein [Deltaproteobacteria bacterium]